MTFEMIKLKKEYYFQKKINFYPIVPFRTSIGTLVYGYGENYPIITKKFR